MNWATYVGFTLQGSCSPDAELCMRIGDKCRNTAKQRGLLQHLAAAWREGGMSSMAVPKAVEAWLAKA
jgi:hypothetical protein